MVDEMKRRQRDAAGQNNLTREDFLQCDVACSAFSCLGGPLLYIKQGCQLAIVTPAHCLLRRERHLHIRQNGEKKNKQTNS